jgi:hypothetical protein
MHSHRISLIAAVAKVPGSRSEDASNFFDIVDILGCPWMSLDDGGPAHHRINAPIGLFYMRSLNAIFTVTQEVTHTSGYFDLSQLNIGKSGWGCLPPSRAYAQHDHFRIPTGKK